MPGVLPPAGSLIWARLGLLSRPRAPASTSAASRACRAGRPRGARTMPGGPSLIGPHDTGVDAVVQAQASGVLADLPPIPRRVVTLYCRGFPWRPQLAILSPGPDFARPRVGRSRKGERDR